MDLLRADTDQGVRARDAAADFLVSAANVEMLVPAAIGDYTDFYASIHHATNVGSMFRPDNPLLPNYKYVPIGYHGRASSIVPSGSRIARPRGQIEGRRGCRADVRAERRLDYELEVGAFIGRGNQLGDADPARGGGGARVRAVSRERLVGARHSELGVSAARTVPGEELRDDGIAVGRDDGRIGAIPRTGLRARCR